MKPGKKITSFFFLGTYDHRAGTPGNSRKLREYSHGHGIQMLKETGMPQFSLATSKRPTVTIRTQDQFKNQ